MPSVATGGALRAKSRTLTARAWDPNEVSKTKEMRDQVVRRRQVRGVLGGGEGDGGGGSDGRGAGGGEGANVHTDEGK